MTPGVPFITQQALADEMGISRRALCSFENGQAALPRSLNAADYLEAVAAIKLRRASEKLVSA